MAAERRRSALMPSVHPELTTMGHCREVQLSGRPVAFLDRQAGALRPPRLALGRLRMLTRLLSTAAALAVLAATAIAAEIKPAIVYDLGGKFDKSFNEGVHNGAEQYKKDTGIEY